MRSTDERDRNWFASLIDAGFSEHEAAALCERPLEWFTGAAR